MSPLDVFKIVPAASTVLKSILLIQKRVAENLALEPSEKSGVEQMIIECNDLILELEKFFDDIPHNESLGQTIKEGEDVIDVLTGSNSN